MRYINRFTLILIVLLLCGCQKNPEQNVVMSKNTGSFDANVIQSATAPLQSGAQKVSYCEEFTSTDGSVLFSLDIQQEIPKMSTPVLEVTPHYLTSEDAERVAKVLFGDAKIYEQRPVLASPETILTKAEIQQRLVKWTEFTNEEYMLWLYGTPEQAAFNVDIVKRFIEDYSECYDRALDQDPRIPCQWTLKGEYVYSYPYEDLETMADSQYDDWNEGIKAEVYTGENTYTYTVSVRDQDDFKVSNIYAYVGGIKSVAGGTIERRQFEAERCRTRPTDEQMEAIKENAANLLEQMELGSWLIDECTLEITYFGDIPEYRVNVSAVPVFNDNMVFRRPQISNLRSTTAYASSYYLTDVQFTFCANGDLLSFLMSSPVDVSDVINENAATISMDELVSLAQKNLSLSDSYGYLFSEDAIAAYEQKYGEKILCVVPITQLDYGLTRVKVPNSDDSYYYVPGMMLSGTVEYRGQESGTVYDNYTHITGEDALYPLVCLNAVDGTVISLHNPLS